VTAVDGGDAEFGQQLCPDAVRDYVAGDALDEVGGV
jgi:hypothetical protein